MHRELSAIARSQDGLLTDAQLRAHAQSEWDRRRWFSYGWLERVGPRTYSIAGAPRTWRFHLRRGLLILGDGAVVSFEAAAALHGLERSSPTSVEFTVPRDQRPGRTDLDVHTTTRLPRIDIVTVDGFPTTSATRTIFDLALARKPQDRIEAAIDSAVRLGLSAPQVLERRLGGLRGSGRWGCLLISDLTVDSGGHSLLERRFLELARTHGLPRPRTQVVHRRGARTVARVDFLFEERGVVVEVNGQQGHASPTEQAKDSQRRNELQDLGLRVYEFTYNQVVKAPSFVAKQLRPHLAA